MTKKDSIDDRLADELSYFYDDALGFVMFAFPWDTDTSIQVVDWESEEVFVNPQTGVVYDEKPEGVSVVTYKEWMKSYRERFNTRYGPDRWACEWLDEVSKEVKKRNFQGTKAVPPIQLSTSSGHGIGKSTLTAWVILWIMSTRPFSKGTVTANTAEQLRTKTWAELGKWHKRCISGHWFRYNSGRGNMNFRHVAHEEEWQCSAQTCREENSESFAGQHAAAATSFYIFDEASAVPDKIYEVREGGTVTGEPMVFDFGNPTRNSGRFYQQCDGKLRHRFSVRKIDSRTVFITNKQRIQEWIDDYGIDSDFVKVRVRGLFPSSGSLQFIPTHWVQRAMRREMVAQSRYAPVTLGVDVARFGDDDSVIYPVVGNDARSFAPTKEKGIYSQLDNVQLAQKVIEEIEFFEGMGVEVSAVFIDVTGVGSGVVDTLVHSGFEDVVVPVNFGTTPVFEPEVYRYRSDEIWGRLRDRIKTDLILPTPPELCLVTSENVSRLKADTATRLFDELTQREFGYTLQGNKIHLETKKDMKTRGCVSPDITDALGLNFCQKVAPASSAHGMQGQQKEEEYDPLEGASVA